MPDDTSQAPRRYVGDAFDQSSQDAWDAIEKLRPVPAPAHSQTWIASVVVGLAEWRRVLLPVEVMATALLRALAGVGFLAIEPLAASVDPLLGKVTHGGGILFVMLALWSILIPIESAIVAPLAKRLGNWMKRSIITSKARRQDGH